MKPATIEQGYFILTLMPSLYCHLRCPHCYLSIAEREDRTILSVGKMKLACQKIDAYYEARGIEEKTVPCYWYGGEPTSMGIPYFTEMAETIDGVFTPQRGYRTKHTVLTSLVSVKDEWFPIFERFGQGEVQSSYDGTMRGEAYMRKWHRRAEAAVAYGLRLATISVVNREILQDGAEKTLDYLSDLGVAETSWLPFMWNDQNAGGAYDRFAPSMNAYSDFMIELTRHWRKRKEAGRHVPEIGQMRFIYGQAQSGSAASNIAGQTLFLMPNGDFVLPDYREGWREFMQPFGNILEQDFDDILSGAARRRYLRRQFTRNGNPECLSCPHADKCLMEFWKDNREDDECFGAKRYVDYLLQEKDALQEKAWAADTLLY